MEITGPLQQHRLWLHQVILRYSRNSMKNWVVLVAVLVVVMVTATT